MMSFLRLQFTRLAINTSRTTFQPLTQINQFSTTNTNMSAPSGNQISQTARRGDGSSARQMQSEVGKTWNFKQAAQEVGSKIQGAPETVTSEVRQARNLQADQSTNNIFRTQHTSSPARPAQSAKVSHPQTPLPLTPSVWHPPTRVPPRAPLPSATPTLSAKAPPTAPPISRRRPRTS